MASNLSLMVSKARWPQNRYKCQYLFIKDIEVLRLKNLFRKALCTLAGVHIACALGHSRLQYPPSDDFVSTNPSEHTNKTSSEATLHSPTPKLHPLPVQARITSASLYLSLSVSFSLCMFLKLSALKALCVTHKAQLLLKS